ncbi:MAG TPA: S41 family peptidase [Ignavibacteriaceae bacterium]|nr:S41 family peptidase [Ignavibacteriaceae bacterium]
MKSIYKISAKAGRQLLVFIILISFLGFAEYNSGSLDKDQKNEIIKKVSQLIIDNYVFPDVAKKIEEHLEEVNNDGTFDKITDPEEFATAVTKEIRFVNNDRHLGLHLNPPEEMEMKNEDPLLSLVYQKLERAQYNNGFKEVKILDGNIGYIDLMGFFPVSVGEETAVSVMKFVQNCDALIFDLRKNGGGNPDMIRLILSYLFENKTHINDFYSRRTDAIEESWTSDEVNGKKMSDVPVFVLTSNYTFSAGEEFTYDIQTQKRGIIIGETTGGGANPGGSFVVNENYRIFIPTGRAINPITKTNWEGVGVKTDVEATAENALDTALVLATKAAERNKEKVKDFYAQSFEKINSDFKSAMSLYSENNNSEADELIFNSLEIAYQNDLLNEILTNLMGCNYLAKGDYPVAIAILKFNCQKYPQSANTFDSLGEAFMKSGNNEMAIKNYKKSLELNPDNKNAEKMIKSLEM